MCQVFAGQDPRNYSSVTRSLRLKGYSTSIRLEHAFWDTLDEIAAGERMTTPQFIAKLYDEVHGATDDVVNFTSLLRCACLIHRERQTMWRMAAE